MIDFWTVDTANGQKAAVVLEVLGLEYRTHTVNLYAGEHLEPEMLARNPFGRLPFIRDGHVPVYGSVAIGLYLAEREGRLLPHEPALRAELFQWLGMLSSDLSPALAGQFLFSEIYPTGDEQVVNYFVATARRMLGVLDQHLDGRQFIVGQALTLADLMAYPTAVTSVRRLPGAMDDFPNIRSWAQRLSADDAIARGMGAG